MSRVDPQTENKELRKLLRELLENAETATIGGNGFAGWVVSKIKAAQG